MNEKTSARLPSHVAIIMDGNGRWAKNRCFSRTQGHIAGVKRVEEIIDYAQEIGIQVMTLFTFSTENWNRPQAEVSTLMNIVTSVLNKKVSKLKRNNMRFQIIGKRDRIPESVLKAIRFVEEETKNNTGLTINLAFNYGSRTEILDAVKQIVNEVKNDQLSVDDINEDVFSQHLYTRGLCDPDLLIRTSGEVRISNFLLWQLSYAELFFTNRFWPDFTVEEFQKALAEYQNRDRRYGNLNQAKH